MTSWKACMSDVIQSRAIFFAPMTFHHNPNRRSNHSLTSIRKAKEKNNLRLRAPSARFSRCKHLKDKLHLQEVRGKTFRGSAASVAMMPGSPFISASPRRGLVGRTTKDNVVRSLLAGGSDSVVNI